MKRLAIGYALLSALLYAVYTPAAKVLGISCPPAYLTAYLYLGSGIGLGILYLLFKRRFEQNEKSIDSADIFDLAIVIVLNVGAGILLNLGIKLSSAVSMSLVGNFEIVATSIIALFFGERISRRLWGGIVIILIASIVLSFDASHLKVSWGIVWGLLATVLWGLENNFTKKLSVKNPIQVVIVKGLGVGCGSYLVALVAGERAVTSGSVILTCLILGFFAFGLSILMYVLAQRYLGAAKTSAYYAISPFVSVILSLIFLHEAITGQFVLAFILMVVGIWIVVADTLAAE
ncbi:DMT family transporter [Limosilactobacillus kribbianus]|uniref:DMT family transporter n=1 Tax=Limosilactobacillus kribbianus TaxID=2982695 RepID=UPI00226543D8|nr:DMT family transporter [Limosilactobacillus kribbianus]